MTDRPCQTFNLPHSISSALAVKATATNLCSLVRVEKLHSNRNPTVNGTHLQAIIAISREPASSIRGLTPERFTQRRLAIIFNPLKFCHVAALLSPMWKIWSLNGVIFVWYYYNRSVNRWTVHVESTRWLPPKFDIKTVNHRSSSQGSRSRTTSDGVLVQQNRQAKVIKRLLPFFGPFSVKNGNFTLFTTRFWTL